jgi:hypothetical protein
MSDDHPITLAAAAKDKLVTRRLIYKKSNAKRYAADPAAVKERVNKWQKANPEKAYKNNKRWRLKNKDHLRWFRIERDYGINREEWEGIFDAQGEVCAICKNDKPGAKHGWHTDHVHETKIVRGILCHQCNTMLGRANDNPENLIKGAEYLFRHARKIAL